MAKRSTPAIPEMITRDLKSKGFKIHALPKTLDQSVAHSRRDFYKIGVVTGSMSVYYGQRKEDIEGTALFFVNPNIPHSVKSHSKKRSGYACVFTEAFIAGRERTEILQGSPLFRFDGTHAIPLTEEQAVFMTGLFQKMLAVHTSNYQHKDEFLRNCLELVIREAMRIRPPQNGVPYKNAATRISSLFMELLERQFPVENTADPLRLRTARDFAESLSVHINYLNRSVKEVTGKATSTHIAERITAEAKALLLYTDWSVADIAYGLGFEYPTYFNNYFKRVTGSTPQSLRKQKV